MMLNCKNKWAFKIYHLMPITQNLQINRKHNTKLALILENAAE